MKIGHAGIELIRDWEGFRSEAYRCPAGKWTIGFGDTFNVKKGDKITLAEAEKRLEKRLAEFEGYVNQLVTVPLNQNQFDALVSFVYNIGVGNFKESTLLEMLNRKDYESASQQLLRWNKSNGQVLPGLTRRRKDEKALFERKV